MQYRIIDYILYKNSLLRIILQRQLQPRRVCLSRVEQIDIMTRGDHGLVVAFLIPEKGLALYSMTDCCPLGGCICFYQWWNEERIISVWDLHCRYFIQKRQYGDHIADDQTRAHRGGWEAVNRTAQHICWWIWSSQLYLGRDKVGWWALLRLVSSKYLHCMRFGPLWHGAW